MFKFLQDEKHRAQFVQFSTLFLLVSLFAYLFHNTQANLERQNIATGFGFLEFEAGFDIGESMIEYWSDDSYLKAIGVGVLNTLKVAVIGNFFAVLLGVIIGLSHLSSNWLLRKVSKFYIETIRNIPLLLQLFFWYALFTENLPGVKEAIEFLPNVFLSNRGLYLPIPKDTTTFLYSMIAFCVSIVAFIFLERTRVEKEIKEGKSYSQFEKLNYLIFLLPVFVWLVMGAPREIDFPALTGFNFSGGYHLSPEFSALVLGLVIYTSAFNAEITRAGISSIDKGQWEAANSLGLGHGDTLKIVILPQALRVMIPPLTSQILNLTKNSSLAVAIGYPDFVSITNTTMNQTGQAIECVFIIMIIYLCLSVSTSLVMNFIASKFKIVER